MGRGCRGGLAAPLPRGGRGKETRRDQVGAWIRRRESRREGKREENFGGLGVSETSNGTSVVGLGPNKNAMPSGPPARLN